MNKEEKRLQGKRNRRKGLEFGRKVKKDLESQGWIVTKWNNNLKEVEKYKNDNEAKFDIKYNDYKCVASKPGPFRQMQTGFPDFMAFKPSHLPNLYEVDFIECKVNGRMKKEENAKAQWYLNSNYCNEFWIASLDDNGDIYYNNKKGEEI